MPFSINSSNDCCCFLLKCCISSRYNSTPSIAKKLSSVDTIFFISATDAVVGQKHLIGEGKILRNIIENDEVPNMIFYGPSGVGKTTIANIIAQKTGKTLHRLNATTSSSVFGRILSANGVFIVILYLLYKLINFFLRNRCHSRTLTFFQLFGIFCGFIVLVKFHCNLYAEKLKE